MTSIVAPLVLLSMIAAASAASAGEKRTAILYKNPDCGCCEQYADYMRTNGFEVTVRPTHDLALIKDRHGVPEQLEGCHTTLIDGYVIEGHVPLDVVGRLLSERPEITGISLPGMPQGSPGMTGSKREPFEIYQFAPGSPPALYAVE